MDYRQTYVTDANIWIDLHAGGLARRVFDLPARFAAPDVIVQELLVPDGAELIGYGLASCELSGSEVRFVSQLRCRERYRAVSTNDLFALVLAMRLKAPLLTGDNHLRRAAEEHGVTVHGVLWLLDEMVRLQAIDMGTAATALGMMLVAGSRLPQQECAARLARWRSR
ncbi:MAG: hypothetical protein H5T95_06085 [Firmicutes bacterium]|nr:hypothetical protein [Bacillota bacterium]